MRFGPASSRLLTLALLTGLALAADAAEPVRISKVGPDTGISLTREPGGAYPRRPSEAAAIGSHGSTVVVDPHGLLVAERSAGELVRVGFDGKRRASVKLSPGLGELVHDGKGGVFVADRGADRVLRVEPGDASGAGLAVGKSVSVPEPHGLALSPDGATLYVTSVSEHELVAVDTSSLAVRWRIELAPEPRAVSVSRDGQQIVVGFLSSGSLAIVEPSGRRVTWRSIEPRDHVEITVEDDGWGDDLQVARVVEARSRFSVPVETGRRYARNVFALAFVGHDTLVAAHQLATPQLERIPSPDRADTYGGGAKSIPPMLHRLARLRELGTLAGSQPGAASYVEIELHQPRALAYELERDVLYVGGYGDDRVIALADASQEAPYVDWVASVPAPCGVDGLAVEHRDEGRGLWIHCEFARQLLRLDLDHTDAKQDWLRSEELATSARPQQIEQGAELFRRSDRRISDNGMMACSNCHPEGRSDGLTWRLGKSIMQAPVLAGRVNGTGPYKWDAQDDTLHASLQHTMQRLGGTPEKLSQTELDAMVAYIDSLPPPKPKAASDPQAAKRGRAVFDRAACSACHVGDKLTDTSQHVLDTTMDHVDTPSLLGLSHSRPYYHDGSAIDLWTLLTDRGTIHQMADTSDLSDAELRDLATYLESL